ncbi:hypothetical protein CRG98_012622 [Punica granatum]|uniref:Uncharacterized protein n=1 Tax=Punica granatum TaxID=22663 RepID=A0A2I0KEM5_PUNGR|nr:hypothetical protein CRG98_012622 [Punica granatum]
MDFIEGPHARDLIARLRSVHLLGGFVTDTRENESPQPVYDWKIMGWCVARV